MARLAAVLIASRAVNPSWREASGKLAYRFHSDSSSFRRLQRAESLQAAGTASLSLSEI